MRNNSIELNIRMIQQQRCPPQERILNLEIYWRSSILQIDSQKIWSISNLDPVIY